MYDMNTHSDTQGRFDSRLLPVNFSSRSVFYDRLSEHNQTRLLHLAQGPHSI